MEYAGYAEQGSYGDVVVRGDLASREFIAFWLAGGRVLAGMNVNIWHVNGAIQHLVRSGEEINRDRLADPDLPLEQHVQPWAGSRARRAPARRDGRAGDAPARLSPLFHALSLRQVAVPQPGPHRSGPTDTGVPIRTVARVPLHMREAITRSGNRVGPHPQRHGGLRHQGLLEPRTASTTLSYQDALPLCAGRPTTTRSEPPFDPQPPRSTQNGFLPDPFPNRSKGVSVPNRVAPSTRESKQALVFTRSPPPSPPHPQGVS